jgi:hypothetical protein
MTYALKKKFPLRGWLVAGFLVATAVAGCGGGSKVEEPQQQFSPKPTSPPNGGSPPKKGGDKARGPGEKNSDY